MGSLFKDKSYMAEEIIKNSIKKNKLKCFAMIVIALIALLTGIIVAIRTRSISTFTQVLGDAENLNDTNFWLRFLSMAVVFSFVVIASLSPWLCPLALLFIAYRAFLMGGNITLLIILNGISGVVVGLLVVLPCQIISLLLFILFYLLLCEARSYKGCYGCERRRNYSLMLVLFGMALIVAICLIESFLIGLLSPKVIFVF